MRIERRPDLLRAAQQQDVGKGFGAGKALGQLHRVPAAIFVIDGNGGVGHLKGGGKGEQQHLDKYRHNQDRPGLRLPQQGLQLFANQRP